jgi:hypothetical protein
MSLHNANRKWRHFRRVVAVVLTVAATSHSHASARLLSDHASVQATAATAGTHAQDAGAPPAGEVLGGITSQGWPIVIEIAKNGKKFSLVRAGLDMRCTLGDSFSLEGGAENLPISSDGKVHGARQIPPSPGSGASVTGGSEKFAGKLNRKRSTFSGMWQLHLTFVMASGQTDQCDSGRVRLTARL